MANGRPLPILASSSPLPLQHPRLQHLPQDPCWSMHSTLISSGKIKSGLSTNISAHANCFRSGRGHHAPSAVARTSSWLNAWIRPQGTLGRDGEAMKAAGPAGCRAWALHVGHVSRSGPASLITSPSGPETRGPEVSESSRPRPTQSSPYSPNSAFSQISPCLLWFLHNSPHLQHNTFTAEVQQSSRTRRLGPEGPCSSELPSCHRGPIADTQLEPAP